MNKKNFWIIARVVVPIVLVVFTGGIWVSVGPSFDYDYNAVTIDKGEGWNTFSFNDAITDKSSFQYHIEDVSFDVDGKEYLFTDSVKYR